MLDANGIIHGALGLTKAALRIDRPMRIVIDERQAICDACDYGIHKINGRAMQCSACQCVIPAKVRGKSQVCPHGKWDAVENVTFDGSENE